MYYETGQQMKKQLGQVELWLDATRAYADTKKVAPDLFAGFRLAPDQFPFLRQVQVTCDTAKLGLARLTGTTAPTHADTEQTLEELRARVRSVIAFIDTLTPADFEGAAAREVTQPRWEGKVMTGADYFREHAIPNFYFHLTTAYAILRHNGVPLGKRDYLGALTMRAP
ncbi:MAG: DUF1993 domain-containing protein [Kofleriaceae bacterium]